MRFSPNGYYIERYVKLEVDPIAGSAVMPS